MTPTGPGSLPIRSDYGAGRYRRCIVLEAEGDEVRGELADDFHHFGVRLRHAGGRVVELAGEDIRVPWTTCPGALEPLRRMQGAPLSRSLLDLLRHTPAREQCTHLHDLACLAIAHAARAQAGGLAKRRFDVAVPDRVDNATSAVLERDGRSVLAWQIQGFEVVEASPGTCQGLRIGGTSFHRFLRGEPDPDLAEAAWVLQRAIFIGTGRRHDFENIHHAATFAPVVGAACHTFAPERVAEAGRVYGSLRDFTSHPERILERDASRR